MSAVPQALAAHLSSLPAERGMRQAALTDWAFTQIIDGAIDAIGVENIVAAVLSAYDKYIVPLDIPGIPDDMEAAYFDAPVKLAIGYTIRGFHAHIHKQKPAGVFAAAAPRTWIGEAA